MSIPARRVLFWFATGLLVLLALLLILYLLRGWIIAPQVKNLLIREIETGLGVRVEIDRVDGTFLTTLELRGVRTIAVAPESRITGLSLRRGKARFWLPDLLAGFDHLLQDADITLEGAELSIDLDRASEEQDEDGPVTFPAPKALPRLAVRDSSFLLQGGDLHLELGALQADLRPLQETGPNQVHLDLRSGAAILDHPRITRQHGPLAATLHYDPEQLVLSELRFAARPLVRQAVLALREQEQGAIALDSTWLVFGGELRLQGERRGNILAARLETERLALEELSAFLAPWFPESAGNLALDADLRVDTDQPGQTLHGSLDLQLLEGRIREFPADRLILQATADQGDILIRRLQGRISDNTVQIKEIGIPAATLFEHQWHRLLEASPGSFALKLNDIPALLEIAGRKDLAREPAIPAHQLVLQGEIGGRRLLVTEGLLKTKTGRIEINRARLQLPPQTPWRQAPLQSSLTLRVPRLAELGAIFGLPGLQGGLTGELDIQGTLGEPQGQAVADGSRVFFRDVGLGDVHLRAVADQKLIRVQTLTLERDRDRMTGQGVFRLEEQVIEALELDFNLAEISHYTPLLPLDQEVAGSVSGNLSASGPLDDPAIRLNARAQQARFAGLALQSVKAVLESRGRTITIEQAALETEYGSLDLAGEVTRGPKDRRLEAHLSSLDLATPDGGKMQLVRPASLAYSIDGAFTAREVLLRGNVGEIHLDGSLSPQTDQELTAKLSGVTSRYWLPLLTGQPLSFEGLEATIVFRGSLRRPYIRAAGEVEELRMEQAPFPIRGSFDFDLAPGGLTIREFAWQGQEKFELFLAGALPLDPWREEMLLPGPLSLDGTFNIPALEPIGALALPHLNLEGALAGDLRLTGTWNRPVGHLQVRGSRVLGRHPDWPSPFQPVDLTAELRIQDDLVRLETLRVASSELELTADGTWTGGPPLGRLLRRQDLKWTGTLDLRALLSIPDIAWLAREVEPIRRLGGELRADLAMTGPVRDPEVKGTVRLTEGEVRTNFDLPPIDPLRVEAALENRRIILRQVEGQLGGAPFTLTGEVRRDPEQGPVFSLNLRGRNLLLVRDEWTLLRADSNLAIQGPWGRLAVSGQLAVSDGYYRKNVAYFDILRGTDRPQPIEGFQPFSLRQEPLRHMTFDVRIHPKEPFRLDNNLATGTLRPDLTLTGTGELPVLTGAVYVDEVRVRLPTTRLEVDSGLILFTEARPNRPSIDLLAHTRMVGYDINVQIEGTLAEPVLILSSTPPLPQDDLLLLLLTGRLPENGLGRDLTRAGGFNIAMYVGRGLLADWLLADAGDESLLERLQIEIGRGITRQGRETLDARLTIAEDVLSRDDALFITAERDVYDDFNVGVKIVFRFR